MGAAMLMQLPSPGERLWWLERAPDGTVVHLTLVELKRGPAAWDPERAHVQSIRSNRTYSAKLADLLPLGAVKGVP